MSRPVADPLADPRYAQFVRLFNEGLYFEAHEVLEALWLESSPEHRDPLQGLVQIAVALEHHRRGNGPGAAKVLRRARERLGNGLPGGPAPAELLAAAEAWMAGGGDRPRVAPPGDGRTR